MRFNLDICIEDWHMGLGIDIGFDTAIDEKPVVFYIEIIILIFVIDLQITWG